MGPLFFIVALTAGPEILKSANISWPNWITTLIAAVGGGALLILTPLLDSRLNLINQDTEQSAIEAQVQDAALQRLIGTSGDLPLIRDVKERGLFGIHPAIELPPDADPSLSPDLPTYVSRDIDANIHTALRAKSTNGGFLLLVGRAASGKTRCAYEAVKSVLGEWRICMPPNEQALTELVEAGTDLTRTVIWLDEVQRFLGVDKLKLETVRRLISNAEQPVIIIGTIWPEEYARLRSPITSESDEDPYQDARGILEIADRFEVSSFTNSENERAASIAEADPRLKEAVTHDSINVTEALAAAPELIYRWKQPDNALGIAVVRAAIRARLCGHPSPVPRQVIEEVAATLMTGQQRALAPENWLDGATEWACQPVRGASALLAPYAAKVGSLDGYTVSDVVLQHVRDTSQGSNPFADDAPSRALIEAATPLACLSICIAAFEAKDKGWAEAAGVRAATSGEKYAFWIMASFCEKWGEKEKSAKWWLAGAETGDSASMAIAGINFFRDGDHEKAIYWLSKASEDGSSSHMGALGTVLLHIGEDDQGEYWTRRAAEAGSNTAMGILGARLLRSGDRKQAETLLRKAVDSGSETSKADLGFLLVQNHETDTEGLSLLREAARAGSLRAMVGVSLFLVERGDHEEAEEWCRKAADTGDSHAMAALGVILRDQDGRGQEALNWLDRAAGEGNVIAMKELARILRSRDDEEGAQRWEGRISQLDGPDS
ncbi:tetratricopeptide repeat protein [Streptomyces sp. NPDC012450]|uniref:tetratricopeptide repeat protein n=1 Tax=Streptomyces sp. NPDC012450 TaxID=3364834 RepID=UPI0036ED0D87